MSLLIPWIKYGKTWQEFCLDKLNRSGTLINIQHGENSENFLIGDINEQGGVCDDCMLFTHEHIVIEYKVVY